MMAISIRDDKGQRILEFLKKELGLPKEVIGFELHMRVNDAITVRNLDYYIASDEQIRDE